MYNQEDSTSLYSNKLSAIRPEFLRKTKQAIQLTEDMICQRDLSNIPQIVLVISTGNFQLTDFSGDMRKLKIICEIIIAESSLTGGKLLFLENVFSFKDLINKYIRITCLLRRLECYFSEEVREDTAIAFTNEYISICAVRKITESEIFADPEYVCGRAMEMMGRKSD